jgi:peptide/nickel transport system permease protein
MTATADTTQLAGTPTGAVETPPSTGSLRGLVLRRLLRHRLAVISLIYLIALIVLAVFADFFAANDPYSINFRAVMAPPSDVYPLGTDTAGRDVWARLLYGARVSLTVGFAAVLLSQSIGITLGLLAGHYGGWLDGAIMRFTDAMMCFPSLVLMIVVAAAFGSGLDKIVLVIGLISWPPVARLVRGQLLALREYDYVIASRVIGVQDRTIILRHLLPNVVPFVIVAATFGVAYAILDEAALSFLGLGIAVPEPSWGNMLSDAQSIGTMEQAPWFWIAPGIAITTTVLAITFLGDGLRDALDPRSLIK